MKKGGTLVAILVILLAAKMSPAGAVSPEPGEGSGYGAIKGALEDQSSRMPLDWASVTLEDTRRGTISNQDGEFTISRVPPGEYTLIVVRMGYTTHRVEGIVVRADETVVLPSVAMEKQAIPLKEIVVSPGSYTLMGSETSVRQTLSSEDIVIMGWAEDITRAVQRSPGIVSDEYGAQFSIRGGDVDEVLVLLDGMQIYKPFHQKDFGGGIFSTVDIEAIEGVDLLTGGFTADYGNRMSGVLSMQSKTPRDGQGQTSVGVSLMNARVFSMGDLWDGRGSYLVSARRGYLDLLNSLMNNEFKLEPSYYDLLGKVEYELNDTHILSLHTFVANDTYGLSEKVLETNQSVNVDSVDSEYGNTYGWLTLKSIFSPDLYARTIVYGGSVTKRRDWENFDLDPDAHLASATIHDRVDLGLIGLKQDWDYQAGPKTLLKVGLDVKKVDATIDYSKSIHNEFITADDRLTEQIESFSTKRNPSGEQLGAYLAGRYKLTAPLTVETGLRYDRASYTKDNLWSPRLSAVYSLTSATFLRAGWGYYYQTQGIDQLRVQFGEFDYDPAERAEHFVLGFEHFFRNGLSLRSGAYHKGMSKLQDEYYSFHDIDEFFPEARSDLVRLSLKEGTSRGIETYLKYDTGNKLSWWLSYVLSEVTDDVGEIHFDGSLIKKTGELPRAWDQRHTLNIDANYRLSDAWHFNATWKQRTGWPNTDFEVRRLQREDGTFAYYQKRGVFRGTRVPSYQRLDARINRHFYTSRGKTSIFLHVINLLNHENVIRYDHDLAEESAESFRADIESEAWFGLIPFIGMSWEF